MKKKTIYEENPFGKRARLGKRVSLKDFPTPAEIAAAERTTKITLSVSARSLTFLKKQAEYYHLPYQVMIRRLLDDYAMRQQ